MRKFCHILTLFILPFLLRSQEYLADVQFYNPENGLAGRYANCTYKDSRGLIWMGTQFGLNRFDGRDFLLFNESTGLPFNQVMNIYEDSEGWLWLFRSCHSKPSCVRNLAFLHTITHEVHTFEEHFGTQTNLRAEDVVSIIENEKKDIFFSAGKQIFQCSKGKIIRTINLEKLKGLPILLSQPNKNALAAYYSFTDENQKSHTVYLSFDLEGNETFSKRFSNIDNVNEFYLMRLFGPNREGLQTFGFEYFNVSKDRRFVIQKDGSLLKDTSERMNFLRSARFHLNPFDTTLWITEDERKVYTPQNGLIFDFEKEFPEEYIYSSYPREIRFDSPEVIWLSGRYGVFRIFFKKSPFRRILHSRHSDIRFPNKHLVYGITPVGKDNFVVSAFSEIYHVDSNNKKPVFKLAGTNWGPPYGFVKAFDGDFWGLRTNSIYRLKIEGESVQIQHNRLTDKNNIQNIFCHYFDGNRLWMGTGGGLQYYDHDLKEIVDFDNYNGFDELKSGLIHQIFRETDDRLWLCTSKGLYLFSPEKRIRERYFEGGTGKFNIPGKAYYQILPAKKGGWWLASFGGVIYWNPNENITRQITTENGLTANEILGVHEDDYGFLWLPTNAGLNQYQIETGNVKHWLEADGISSDDFEAYSHLVEEDGTVWFGSTNGYTVFHPKDFKDYDFTTLPDIPLNILTFEQFSKESKQLENRTAQILQNKQITMLPGEQFFNLRVALADYVNGDDAKYAYRIEGFQDFWQEGKENLIRISGLPYGNYILKIRGRLADGQYSSNEIHLPVRVLKPFYLRTWFFVVAGFGLLFLFFIGNYWRIRSLKKRQTELETLVAQRTETIEKQAEELRHLDEVKSRFFANVSHELRTPLTLLLAPIKAVLKSNHLNNRNFTLLSLARQNGQALLKLVNQILDLSRLDSDKLEVRKEPVLFYEFVQRLESQFESMAKLEGIELRLDFQLDPYLKILSDKAKFETVFNNLLSNALKFTPKGGKVQVEIKQSENNNRPMIQLTVRDTGRGIHPDDLPHIFDRFYQSSQNQNKEGGSGIGLAICRELAELLNGRIWVKSQLGEGSEFVFEFPKIDVLAFNETVETEENREDLSSIVLPAMPQKSDSDKHSKILLVEDNHHLRQYLTLILSEADCHVISAVNGDEAIQILNKENRNPDLIISDLMMPVMDGFQLLDELKADENWRDIPVIMLTARTELRDKLHALRIGVDDYLAKPFENEELLARVKNLIRNKKVRLESKFEENEGTNYAVEREKEWLEQLEKTILENIGDSNFNIQILAQKMNQSRRQFHRHVKQAVGLTPHQYLKEVRFQYARQLLENQTFQTVKEVAGAIGVKDVKYFSQQFKTHFGKLPSEYFRAN